MKFIFSSWFIAEQILLKLRHDVKVVVILLEVTEFF